jgi:hypothetical protein
LPRLSTFALQGGLVFPAFHGRIENSEQGEVNVDKETRQRYEKRMLDAMQEEGNKKLQCDFFTKKIGLSRDYVLQLMQSLGEQGLVEFELAKRAPEKKSWVRLKSGD